ncbi:MAG: signal recognition particle protein [Phycisphaerales bacterium]|nr:signal recognition particle protein [Phycisphaerales bacterium]
MFENLTDKLSLALRSLSGRGRITESNVREAMSSVETALLEADVHRGTIKEFCAQVVADALGADVLKSIRPEEQMVAIVHARLVELMGPAAAKIVFVEPAPTVVMLCGLQGAGKTTTAGKIAAWLSKRGKSVLLAACDLQRPAAVEQLRLVAEGAAEAAPASRIAFHGEPDKCAEYGAAVGAAVGVASRALTRARQERFDVLILDTAGRLHIDDVLMSELQAIDRAIEPHEILLVVDAMTGQDAVTSAAAFHARLAIDGLVLTKLDSDTRGGAALSAKKVTGAPIKFVGTSEHWDGLDEFDPRRMAGRILGMGDVVALVEKAQEQVDLGESERLAAKMAAGRLTMDDFLSQLKSLRRMGPLKQLLGMLPGVGSMVKDIDIDEKQFDRIEGMIRSMTSRERETPSVLDRSRVKRIAQGSGTNAAEVGRLTKQFEMMQKMMKQVAGGGVSGMMSRMKAMGQAAGGGAGGLPAIPAGVGGVQKSRFKQRPKR